jgi:hypothetical protein
MSYISTITYQRVHVLSPSEEMEVLDKLFISTSSYFGHFCAGLIHLDCLHHLVSQRTG